MKEVSRALVSLLKVQDDIILKDPNEKNLEYYLFEQYANDPHSWKRRAYYLAKPLIPRPLQLAIRRRYARALSTTRFPAWPIEPIIVESVQKCLRSTIQGEKQNQVHRIAPWPKEKRFAFSITHDVEWAEGLARAYDLVDLERSFGMYGSWNIVPERYRIDWNIFNRLRSDGFEIGVQGLSHDGTLFDGSRTSFERQSKKIRHYARQWGAEGFRSPSTLRKVEWMPDLGFDYDSSFPDTDPYEPQPGGCCSIWPYFIRDLVELPLTMPQDHTLFDVLGHNDISVWEKKADWIEGHSGLVLLTVHPDYLKSKNRLRLYETFLSYMSKKSNMWHAQPKDIARWWRERDASRLTKKNGSYVVEGPIAGRSAIIKTTLDNGILKDEVI